MTRVWKGAWRVGVNKRKIVALKQLTRDAMGEKLGEFLQLCYQTMIWEDGSLVSVMGCCLPWQDEPPALVTEYFALGPLNR